MRWHSQRVNIVVVFCRVKLRPVLVEHLTLMFSVLSPSLEEIYVTRSPQSLSFPAFAIHL